MKKTLARGLALTAVGTALAVGSAWATPISLTLEDGTNMLVVFDGGAYDANPAPDVVTYVGPFGDWVLNVSTGASPVPSATVFPDLDLNTITSSTQGAELSISLFDPDPDWSPGITGLVLDAGGTLGGNGTIEFMVDVGGTTLASLGPFTTPGSFGGTTGSFLAGPGYIALTAHLFHETAGTTSFDADLQPVPEPATMLLLGTGLAGLAGIGRRKVKKA